MVQEYQYSNFKFHDFHTKEHTHISRRPCFKIPNDPLNSILFKCSPSTLAGFDEGKEIVQIGNFRDKVLSLWYEDKN